MLADIITISPHVQSGAPVFAGTRVPVKNLFDYLKGGDNIDTFVEDFPSVSKDQVLALLSLMENFLALRTEDYEKSAA